MPLFPFQGWPRLEREQRMGPAAPAGPAPEAPAARSLNGQTGIWHRMRPIGFKETVSTTGGIAAPLLAGFCLTAVTQLVTSGPTDSPRFVDAAIAFFAVAAALLLYALQFSAIALGYRASPGERLDFYPEAKVKPQVMEQVRRLQWQESVLWQSYCSRAGLCYNLGLIAFLLGLAGVMVPRGAWSWGRVVAIAVTLLATGLEAVWAMSNASWPRWLLPTRHSARVSSVAPAALADDPRAVLFESNGNRDALVTELARLRELLEQTLHVHQDAAAAPDGAGHGKPAAN